MADGVEADRKEMTQEVAIATTIAGFGEKAWVLRLAASHSRQDSSLARSG